MTHEIPQQVSLGEQRRARHIRPGEVFLGTRSPDTREPFLLRYGGFTFAEYPDTWGPSELPLAREMRQLRSSGKYTSVRRIPVFLESGSKVEDLVEIVARPKQTP